MVVVRYFEPAEWVELDEYGRVFGKPFLGTAAELQLHLRRGVEDLAELPFPQVEDVWVSRPLGEVAHCTLVVMRTPWGEYRWIPRPSAPE